VNPLLILSTALSSVGANKLRAGLTLLGIVIGVAAVVSLMAIGRGAQETVTSRITALGTNLIFVRPGSATEGGFVFGQGTAETLTLEDAQAIEDRVFVPDVVAVAPESSTGLQIVAGSQNTFATTLGVTSAWLDVRNIELGEGRPITPADVANELQVVVLGSNVVDRLFQSGSPVGQAIRLNGRQFIVIGVMERQGGTGFGNIDDQILVPITTAHFRLNGNRTPQGDVTVNTINVQAAGSDSLDDAIAQVESLLRLRHRIAPGDDDDFTVTNQQDTIETLESTTDTFVVFLAAVAGISLVVGGIGIMNIMLVSVTERTREIGIRRAVGAKRRDVLLQFVTEATLLSAAGGLVGIALGSAVAEVIDGRTFGSEEFQTVLNADVAIYALAVSAAIGLFFGIYPAARAARLDPIEALRQV